MSDFSLLGEFEQYGVTDKYKSEKEEKSVKWLKILVIVLVAIALVYLCYSKIISPSLEKPDYIISGNSKYSTEYLCSLLEQMPDHNWFSYDTEGAAARLSSISGIDSVNIEKVFPDKIKISLVERQSVAMMFINNNGRTVPIQIDKNGVLFSNINGGVVEDGSIPIISGIPVEHLAEGMRIPAKYRVLVDQIANIQAVSEKYFAAISEICVVPKTYGNYELMLIPANSKIRVLTGRSLNLEALQYMMVVIDVVNDLDPQATEIDLRYDSVSYRTAVNKDAVGGENLD